MEFSLYSAYEKSGLVETRSSSELGEHGEGPNPKDDVLVLLHSIQMEIHKWQTVQVTNRSVFIYTV